MGFENLIKLCWFQPQAGGRFFRKAHDTADLGYKQGVTITVPGDLGAHQGINTALDVSWLGIYPILRMKIIKVNIY